MSEYHRKIKGAVVTVDRYGAMCLADTRHRLMTVISHGDSLVRVCERFPSDPSLDYIAKGGRSFGS